MEVEDNVSSQDPATMSSTMRRCLLARNKLAVIIKRPGGESQYCCVQCPVKCDSKEDLEQHLFAHNKEYRHLCGICGTGLKRKEHLDRHTLEHQQVRPHVCEVCSKAFKRKEHLNIHKSIHSGDKNEVCMLCHKSFYRKDHLQKHLQTHSKTFIEQNISEQEFATIKAEVMELEASDRFNDSSQDQVEIEDIEITPDQGSIIIEEEPTPPQELRPYACDLCDKTYKRKDHLKLHSQTHMKKDKICIQCGRAFVTDEKLLQHMIHVHSVVKTEEDAARLHAMLSEHNIDPAFLQSDNSLLVPRASEPLVAEAARRHECGVCRRRFKRRQHLVVHQAVHNRTQPNIWCSRCNQGFFNNQSFESHSCMGDAVEFLNIKIEPSAPEDSHQPIDKKENEHPHIKILPLESPEDSTVYAIRDESALPAPRRVYVCKFCGKPFKRKDHYKIHLHIHTGVRSFFCDVCGKGFYRKDHLQKHEFVHLKPKAKPKPKKALPDLFPINKIPKKIEVTDPIRNTTSKKEILPEITIHAPSNTKLRVPLQIKVPYQMVVSMDNGEERAVTIDPSNQHESVS